MVLLGQVLESDGKDGDAEDKEYDGDKDRGCDERSDEKGGLADGTAQHYAARCLRFPVVPRLFALRRIHLSFRASLT